MNNEETEKIQEMISIVLTNDPTIQFKTCKTCGRRFPAHEWFFTKHPKSPLGVEARCKECVSLSKGRNYKIISAIDYPWHHGKEEEFIKMFRIMADYQLAEYFSVNISDIKNTAKILNIKMGNIINNLSDNEIICIYDSILNGKRKCLPNGVYLNVNNKITIFRYLINDILQWNRKDICDNINTNTLKKYKIDSMIVDGVITLYDLLTLTFPNYELKKWELKKSSVGEWNDESVSDALSWLRERLYKDKNIDNINYAGTYSFKNLLDEYNFNGLCVTKFDGSSILLFEKMYGENFSKEEMLKDNYTFNIDTNCIPTILEGSVYKLNDSYYKLNDRGKTLVNEVIRFCEKEKTFPKETDLSNNKGYICRTQFYKYFGENTLKQLYTYISPIYDFAEETDVDKFRNIVDGQNYNIILIKPNKIACIKCGKIKEFTKDNFSEDEAMKFGLNYTCRDCENKYVKRLRYNNIGIEFENITDISPVEWWEYLYENKLKVMPEFCYTEENLIEIIKHVINNVLNLHTKEEICDVTNFGREQLDVYRIDSPFYKLGKKVEVLQKCFPELNITNDDVFPEFYLEDEMNEIISSWIKNNNLTVIDLLSKGITYTFDKKMNAMMSVKFHKIGKSRIDMIIWYCSRNNIFHPIHNRPIIKWDFDEVSQGFWNNKQNRIDRIKYYCEHECNENIFDCINDTLKLRSWIYKYFRQESIVKIISYSKKEIALYDLLIDAYPEILSNRLLFEWEWHQYSKNDRDSLIIMLRELILYRLNDLVADIKEDVPKYLNSIYLGKLYPKFTRQISKNRFNSYYEWGCLAFPEYADYWTPQMFGSTVAYDGTKCGSKQEMMIYEFAKIDLSLNYFKSIGNKRSGEFVFELGDEYEYERFCPDFALEYIDVDTNKIKLTKPIIVEFYGMYFENHKCYIYQNYVYKTKVKNKFYNSRDDIIFVDLYPDDLKNGCQEVKNKISDAINEAREHIV